MAQIDELTPGRELDNAELCETFLCGPQGGMRRAHRTNALVLICNHVDSIYDDRWIEGVLHYTGMGQSGDQSLSFMQNRTLADSGSNGVHVHLFEVHQPRRYTYAGEVGLAGVPYSESQPDQTGQLRQVWVFPLRPTSGAALLLPAAVLAQAASEKSRRARRLTDAEIAMKAVQSGNQIVGARPAVSQQFQRNPWVAEHAKRRSDGRCELCKEPAPFTSPGGEPYLEVHHIKWLAHGGADTIENTVALCPNCHRRMHIVRSDDDAEKLTSAADPTAQ